MGSNTVNDYNKADKCEHFRYKYNLTEIHTLKVKLGQTR